MHKGFSIAGKVAYAADMFLKIIAVCLHDVIPEMQSFSMRLYDKPLPKYLDPKTVLIYRPRGPVHQFTNLPGILLSIINTGAAKDVLLLEPGQQGWREVC